MRAWLLQCLLAATASLAVSLAGCRVRPRQTAVAALTVGGMYIADHSYGEAPRRIDGIPVHIDLVSGASVLFLARDGSVFSWRNYGFIRMDHSVGPGFAKFGRWELGANQVLSLHWLEATPLHSTYPQPVSAPSPQTTYMRVTQGGSVLVGLEGCVRVPWTRLR